jgi:hypothetical protein
VKPLKDQGCRQGCRDGSHTGGVISYRKISKSLVGQGEAEKGKSAS